MSGSSDLSCLSNPPWLDHRNNTCYLLGSTNYEVMNDVIFSCLLLLFLSRFKYVPQCPVLRHPKPTFFLNMRESKFNVTPQQSKVLRQLAPSQHLMSYQDLNPCDHGGWHKQAVQKHCICNHSPLLVVHGQVCSFVAHFQSSCCCWPSRVDVISVDRLFHLNCLNQFSLGIWELCRHLFVNHIWSIPFFCEKFEDTCALT
jgi:hypothetical protein